MAGQVKIPTIFTAIDKFSAPVRKMNSTMTRFTTKASVGLARVERRVRSLTPSFRGLNRMLGGFGAAIGGALVIGALSSAINVFSEFEQANATLASVMSSATQPELQALQEDAKRLGATTAKTATEVVGLQEAYGRLGFVPGQIIDMTEATIAGSIAMNAQLADTAELTGAVVNSFDKFSSVDAPEIMDQMVLSTQKSALSFEKLQTSIPIVAGAANSANVSFTEMTASLGVLSDAGIDASSSATALRNIYLEAAKRGVSYQSLLEKVSKSTDKLKTSNEIFGKRGAVVAVSLANNQEKLDKLDKTLKSAAAGQENSGAANVAAAKQLDTLQGSLTLLGSAYEGFILSIESGNGTIGVFIRDVIKIATEILSLASGTEKAEEQLTTAEKRIRSIAERVMFFAKVIGTVIAAYITANTALRLFRIGLVAFNIVQGVSTALMGGSALALRGSSIAMAAFGATTKIVTAAQWLWNAAMLANPIGLIIVGVVALITLLTLIIVKYNEWGAAVTLLMGPLGMLINMIQAFRRNWDGIVQAFEAGNILEAFKLIGATILDSVLMPLEQVLSFASKVPGIGEFAQGQLSEIQQFRQMIGVNTETNEAGEPINAEAAREEARVSREESVQRGEGVLRIENNTGNEASFSGVIPNLDVVLGSTQGNF